MFTWWERNGANPLLIAARLHLNRFPISSYTKEYMLVHLLLSGTGGSGDAKETTKYLQRRNKGDIVL